MKKKGGFEGYASHIPVLQTVAKELTIKTVIEFGCGFYSTSVFLNRFFFPDLTNLYSYETNEKWYELIKENVLDQRLNIILLNKIEIGSYAYEFPVDLVFIDGEKRIRGKIIREMQFLGELFVCHDGPKRKRNKKRTYVIINNYIKKIKKLFDDFYIYFPPYIQLPSTVIFSNAINVKKIGKKINWPTDYKRCVSRLKKNFACKK